MLIIPGRQGRHWLSTDRIFHLVIYLNYTCLDILLYTQSSFLSWPQFNFFIHPSAFISLEMQSWEKVLNKHKKVTLECASKAWMRMWTRRKWWNYYYYFCMPDKCIFMFLWVFTLSSLINVFSCFSYISLWEPLEHSRQRDASEIFNFLPMWKLFCEFHQSYVIERHFRGKIL